MGILPHGKTSAISAGKEANVVIWSEMSRFGRLFYLNETNYRENIRFGGT